MRPLESECCRLCAGLLASPHFRLQRLLARMSCQSDRANGATSRTRTDPDQRSGYSSSEDSVRSDLSCDACFMPEQPTSHEDGEIASVLHSDGDQMDLFPPPRFRGAPARP